MDIVNSARVNELSSRVILLQKAIELIDAGATISSLTLRRPDPQPPVPPLVHPRAQPESESGPEPEEEVEHEQPEEEADRPSSGELTVSSEGLHYPPQMIAAIRAQQIEMWQEAYRDLSALGVTNVPQPGTGIAAQQHRMRK